MTQDWLYPTAFSSWGEEEEAAIARVVASRRFTMGEEVARFEAAFAAYHGMPHAIMVNSGSSANLVAVAALDLWPANRRSGGGAAALPAVAWSTTYAPVLQHGYELQLVDIDETWNAPVPATLDLSALSLIVGCSVLGNPGYMPEWAALASLHGVPMLEDNCESLGASVDGHLCGTFADVCTFSFYWSHQVSAIEGGMILTRDAELADLCRMFRAHGWTRDVEAPVFFENEYDFRVFGYNVRPLEMHAAVAHAQLPKQEAFAMNRFANWELFRSLVGKMPISLPALRPRAWPNPFGLAFTVASAEVRARLVRALRAEGIDCRLATGGSFRRHAYGAYWAGQATPAADRIHERGLFLGNAPFDIQDQIERAVAVMRRVLG